MKLKPYAGKTKTGPADPSRTTVPGHKNPHRQVVIRKTGSPSTSFRGQTIYELRCEDCKQSYGANGCDIHIRRCPNCQNGAAGEPVPALPASLFDLAGVL